MKRLLGIVFSFALVFSASAETITVTPGSGSGGGGPTGSSPMAVFNVAGVGNGIADDQAAFNAALTQCSNAGGGWVVPNGRNLIDTVGLVIPTSCVVKCPTSLLGNANPTNYSTVPRAVILNPAVTISSADAGSWEGCPVFNKNAVAASVWTDYPTLTQRDLLNLVGTFAGTAFTIAKADVQISKTFIGGFAVGISASPAARLQLDRVNIDATKCMLLDNSHDISTLNNVECFPFMTSGMTNVTTTFAISNIANNGSGLYRVTLTTPSTIPQTGDTVWIDQTIGTGAVQSIQARQWVITVIDSSHFDLQGSAGTGSVTPTVTTHNISKTLSGLSSSANLGIGQTCTGTGIPAASTIQWLAPAGLDLGINNLATAGGSITMTCTDGAYASGGNATLEAAYRSGIGFEFTNSEGTLGHALFAFGHSNAYHVGTGQSWFACDICFSDGLVEPDISIVQLLVDGTAKGTTFTGGRLNNQVRVNSSSGFLALTLNGVMLDTTSTNAIPIVELDQGRSVINANGATNGNGFILVKDAITAATIGTNDFVSGQYAFETGVGDAKVNTVNNTLNPNVFAGGVNMQNQRVILGNISGACTVTDGNGCPVETGAPFADASTNTQNIVTGGTVALSGNSRLTLFHGTAGSTLSTFTLTLPSPIRIGGEQQWFFDQAISTLTLNGVTQTGMPTGVAANTWYKCIANTASNYLCGPG